MIVPTVRPARIAVAVSLLAAALLPASAAAQAPKPAGSCEAVAARQAADYMDRVKARQHAEASAIAQKTADLCLEAGDIERARAWFQTAQATGSRSAAKTKWNEQWRHRYQAAAEAVPAAARRATRNAEVARRAEAARSAKPSSPVPSAQIVPSALPDTATHKVDPSRVFWIAGAGIVGILMLGGAMWRRRRDAIL